MNTGANDEYWLITGTKRYRAVRANTMWRVPMYERVTGNST